MGLRENDKDARDDGQERGPDATSLPRRDASCSSSPTAKGEKVSMRAASWNLAGVSTKDIETVFAHVVDCDVVAVQEFPKQAAGWKIITGDKFHGIIHQIKTRACTVVWGLSTVVTAFSSSGSTASREVYGSNSATSTHSRSS